MKSKEEKLITQPSIEKLKLKSDIVKSEIHVEKGLTEQVIVESARAKSKIRKLGQQIDENTKDMDSEIKHLEWALELSQQEQIKIKELIDNTKLNLESTITKFSQQLQQKKIEHSEQEALLKSELQMYLTELESLREFQSQRAQMEEELRNLDQTLVQQRQIHQETMEQLRQQLAKEKKQYEDENKRRIREAEKSAVNMKDEYLEAAAIRCIQDSTSVSQQLKKIQIKSKEVLNSNQNLIQKIEDMKRDNQLLEDRKKILEKDVLKYKKKIDNIKNELSEHEIQQTKERAKIETDSATIIESLNKEIELYEKDNLSQKKQLEFYINRIDQVENQKKMSSNEMNQLISLITSTAPFVINSLQSNTNINNKQPEPLQALINKLSEAVEENPSSTRSIKQKQISKNSQKIQTDILNLKYF